MAATVDELPGARFRAKCAACGWRHDLATTSYHVALCAAQGHACPPGTPTPVRSMFVRSEWIEHEPYLSADDLAVYLSGTADRARAAGDLAGARAIQAVEHELCAGVRRAVTPSNGGHST